MISDKFYTGQGISARRQLLRTHLYRDSLDSPTESLQEIERQSLAAAMAQSLEEDDIRKAAETPLEEWDETDLLLRYKDSSILREVNLLLSWLI